jgi:hypothetical protein
LPTAAFSNERAVAAPWVYDGAASSRHALVGADLDGVERYVIFSLTAAAKF